MSDADSAVRRLIHWATTLALGLLAGSVGGAMLGQLLARVSFDYIVLSSDYLHRGLQLGLAAGAVVGACQVVGQGRASAGLAIGLRALAAALGVTLLCVGGGVAVAYAAFRWGWLDMSGWRLPNPSRHALLIGADRGLDLGAALGIAGAGAWVLVQRWRCASR